MLPKKDNKFGTFFKDISLFILKFFFFLIILFVDLILFRNKFFFVVFFFNISTTRQVLGSTGFQLVETKVSMVDDSWTDWKIMQTFHLGQGQGNHRMSCCSCARQYLADGEVGKNRRVTEVCIIKPAFVGNMGKDDCENKSNLGSMTMLLLCYLGS